MPSYSEIEESGKILDRFIEGNEEHYDALAEEFAKEEGNRRARNSAFMDSLFRKQPNERGE
jgi:hypothetical protein